MRKIAGFLAELSILGLFLFQTPLALADSKVSTSADVTYQVLASANTHVTARIQLTNTTPNFYASSYSLKLGFTTVSNLAASDPLGPVTPVIQQTDSGEQITVPFTAVVSGQGKTLAFTLNFDTPDIASHNGTIWEVNIPGLSSSKDFDGFTTHVVVPDSFGKPTFIKPQPKTDGPLAQDSLTFTKDQLETSGISLEFGSSQTYAYNVVYHLENTALYPIATTIALPPTTNYQDVSLDSITPQPESVTLDEDGNWLAHYHLASSQKLSVTAQGLIAVSLTPKTDPLSATQKQQYLQAQPYWQTNSSQIENLANNLKTPEAIYAYVVNHLTYDFNKVKTNQVRLGAAGVLQNPTSAVCLEFTDLFIALARAAGIPAREVDGFGYTQNTVARPLSLSSDILHAWPEYYDSAKQTWVMVDPTWENTTGGVDYFHTLDFDHLAFVVKGMSSIYPVPAGGYKFANNPNEKDVSVIVTQEQITAQPTVNLAIHLSPAFFSAFPIAGSVSLQNTGSVLMPSQKLELQAMHISPRMQFIAVSQLPPFGQATYQFSFQKPSLLTNTHDTVTISLDGKKVSQTIAISLFANSTSILLGGLGLGIFILVIFAFASSSRSLSIFK